MEGPEDEVMAHPDAHRFLIQKNGGSVEEGPTLVLLEFVLQWRAELSLWYQIGV